MLSLKAFQGVETQPFESRLKFQIREEGQYRRTDREEGQITIRMFNKTSWNCVILYLAQIIHNSYISTPLHL